MKTTTTLICALILSVTFCFSNGVAIVDAHQGIYFDLLESHVDVLVNNQIATTKATHVFKNTTTNSTKITYAFPLPENASTTNIRWYINGVWQNATIIASPQDTSLPGGVGGNPIDLDLENYLGNTPLYFKLNETIDTNEIITIELTYVELLPYSDNWVEYEHSNDYTLIQNSNLDSQSIHFHLISARDIVSLDLDSHSGGSIVNNTNTADLSWSIANSVPDTDYYIQYNLDASQLGLFSFSTFIPDSLNPCDTTDIGYFAMIVEPDGNDTSQVIDKVFTLIIDVSGSMGGNKIQQAKDAATFIVNNMNFGDKFNIVTFSTNATSWQPNHVDVNATNQASALNFISQINSGGGTYFNQAFNLAIPQFSYDTTVANIVIFMTDGHAANTNQVVLNNLATNISSNNLNGNIQIHTFGIGSNVNQTLLSQIATQHDGVASFVGSNDLFSAISTFYSYIQNPVLLNVQAAFNPSNIILELYPLPLPNLYKGQQMIIVGKYSTPDTVQATFSGLAFGNQTSFQYDVNLVDTLVPQHQFLTKIWAKMKIDYLMKQYYNAGNDTTITNPLENEVTDLSLCYGVISPFTSYIGYQNNGGAVSEVELELPKIEAKVFPNPFTTSTRISFSLGQNINSDAIIKIYDSMGRLIKVIQKSMFGNGEYVVEWDGTNQAGASVPVGMYFYSIEIENEQVFLGKIMKAE